MSINSDNNTDPISHLVFGETTNDIRKPSRNCRIMSQDMWWGAIGSSFTVFLGGILFILLYRGLRYSWMVLRQISRGKRTLWRNMGKKSMLQTHEITISGKHKISHLVLDQLRKSLSEEEIEELDARQTSKVKDASLYFEVQEWAQRMVSAQSLTGRVLVMTVFLLSFGSLFIYFVTSIESNDSTKVVLTTLQTVDLCFNVFFLFYFGLRFLAADDKLRFWYELNSIVDFFTIPPVIVALYFHKDCIGLRFMRSLRLLQLPEILQYLRILRRNTKIKLASLLSVFLGTWFTAAGFIHTIENSGDPWLKTPNEQTLTYWQCVYLLMVTMSTVGYGDLTARTTVGQVFMVFFIILGLALFASHVPEIIEIIGSHRKYTGKYKRFTGKKYVILCGHITLNSLHDFLKDFACKEREEISTEIVIMENINPGLELQALFKRHVTEMEFFQGSVLNPSDLDRIRPDIADACLILADKNCLNPEAEDSTNIMRAIAVKQYWPEIRVIAQVLQYHSKAYLQNLPSWDMKKRDSVICLSELKMGFIAQNCIVPGFSTLLANLFVKKSKEELKTGTWLDIYQEGLSQELYTEFLSDTFVGMNFSSVCELCYIRLKLLLIAIKYKTSKDEIRMRTPLTLIAEPLVALEMEGQPLEPLESIWCSYTRSAVREFWSFDPVPVKEWQYSSTIILINPGSSVLIQEQTLGFFIAKKRYLVNRANIYCSECHADTMDPRRIKKCGCKRTHDPEAMYYSPNSRMSLGVVTKDNQSQGKSETGLQKELVKLDSTGMFHWCPPKGITQVTLNRAMASRLRLTKHVIVCIFSEPHCPGIGLRNFIMPLRASSFTYDELKSIVIVGSLQYIDQDWSTISNFPKVFILPGSPLCRADLKAVSIGSCDMTVIISSNRTNVLEKTLEDKECILATLNIKAMVFEETMDSSSLLSALFSGNEAKSVNTPPSIENKHYYRIPIITALVHDSNVHLLDQEDRDDPDTEFYLTQPYASGCVFASNILNSLMCTTYFNDNILMLIRTLVTGGGTPELEEQLADEDALRGSIHAQGKERQRDRCKLARISLCDERFTEFAERGTYGDLFCKALNIYGILCFGIFRLQDPEKQSKKRFVITNPSPLFELNSTDFIMCSVPFPDTQTMATAPYCQKNFSSKFTPLHSLTRRSSIRFTKVHQNLADSSNELKLKDEQRLSDAKYVSTIKVAEEGLRASSKSKLKSVEQTTIEQVKEILKTGDWMKSSKDKKKSIDFTVTEYSKEAPKYDDEIVARQSKKQLKSGEEIIPEVLKKELQVIVGESKDEAKSGEEITVEESNEEAESGEEITAGKSKNEAKSGEEITAGKSKNEAKSGEEITAGKSKDEAKSGEEITAGKSNEEAKSGEEITAGKSKDEAKSGEEITAGKSNEEAKSGEEITAGKSNEEAKSGEEITAGKSNEEAKSGEEITAGKSKDEAKSGEEITAGKSKDEEKV